MKHQIVLIATMFLLVHSAEAVQSSISNKKYKIEISPEGKIKVSNKISKVSVDFNSNFMITYSQINPKLNLDRITIKGDTDNILYKTASWNKQKNLFEAGQISVPATKKMKTVKDTVFIEYADCEHGILSAKLVMYNGHEEPALSFEFKPKIDGYFSIGYYGGPERSIEEVEEIWQPLIWTQKRFPGDSYLTPDFLCPLPASAAQYKGITYGVVADPNCFPFNPLPTFKNSVFGVALRNQAGNVQPMLWAPVLGNTHSKMQAGNVFKFCIRLFVEKKDLLDTQEELALNLYKLKNYWRTNTTGSLNATLERMIRYGMSDHSRFVKELKACSYETDVKNAVKNTSAINPLSIALVTDNKAVYEERFEPMLEFMLSRDNLLFSLEKRKGEDGQIPSTKLGKPVMNASEAVAIYDLTGKQSTFLIRNVFEKKRSKPVSPKEKSWREQLALYISTGNKNALDNAITGANQYINEVVNSPATEFDCKHNSKSSFWTQLSPKFPDLYNLYEITNDKKYLDAAREGAHRYAQYIWMSPAIPEGQTTVNIGGKAPKQKRWGEPMAVPEEKVDNFRLSEIGLHCECAATSHSHRAVFPAHYAAYMLKIASHSHDAFLRKIANWAIVGRYSNFPGYHINTDRTTAYEKEDFPLRSHSELNVNSMHYNHIWPQISILLDYLVSDAYDRSDYNIHFPFVTTEAFANLGSNAYGHLPGTFYGDSLLLWMPEHLLSIDNEELNYISGRNADNNKLYIAFCNQSTTSVSARVNFNEQLVSTDHELEITQWINAQNQHSTKIDGKYMEIEVPPLGITAVRVENVKLNVKFQDKLLSSGEKWLTDYSSGNLGRGMIINAGKFSTRFYSYVMGEKNQYESVRLAYSFDNKKFKYIDDADFPFEFSFPLDESVTAVYYQLTVTDKLGNEKEDAMAVLSRK